ncbi:MAG: RICIN domain-containing protein [Eubacteriales bacterium]|nr:RICIN domain-containing protein [Eubacteriales bacterium]
MIFHSPKYKKRIASAILCGSVMLSAGAPVFAWDDAEELVSTVFEEIQTEEAASVVSLADSGYALQRLGVVVGDENGDLMLDNSVTRQEAFTLFLSLLGEQDVAQATQYSYTFQDVSPWFSDFAGYGQYTGYTAGYSETEFGKHDTVKVQQYMTFVLRALGYVDGQDYTWKNSLDKAVQIGLCTQSQADTWAANPFLRQQIMEISYLALSTKMKDSDCTLADKLIADGEFSSEAAAAENLTFGTTYVAPSDTNNGGTAIAHSGVTAGTYIVRNVGTGSVMTAGGADKQANVYAASSTGSESQRFTIQNNSDGSFQIVSSQNTALTVDVHPRAGATAILWSANQTDCQTFVAVQESDGVYSFRLASDGSLALEVVDGDIRLNHYSGASTQQWKLSTGTEDTAAATAKLASIMTVHPDGKSLGSSYSFGGASQCMGFGREVFYRMYGETAKWGYDGSPKSSADAKLYKITASSSSYSASSIQSLISKAKPGDILQMNSPKMHTMVFVSSDSSGFTVYDANWTGPNKVSVRYVKYGAWSSRNSKGITLLHATNYPIS